MKNVMVKVCYRRPEEMKMEGVEQTMQMLLAFGEPVEEMEQETAKLKGVLSKLRRQFFDYEQEMKTFYYNESDSLLYDNDRLLEQLSTFFKVLGDQLKKVDIDIKDKHIYMEEFLGLMEAVRVQMG